VTAVTEFFPGWEPSPVLPPTVTRDSGGYRLTGQARWVGDDEPPTEPSPVLRLPEDCWPSEDTPVYEKTDTSGTIKLEFRVTTDGVLWAVEKGHRGTLYRVRLDGASL